MPNVPEFSLYKIIIIKKTCSVFLEAKNTLNVFLP